MRASFESLSLLSPYFLTNLDWALQQSWRRTPAVGRRFKSRTGDQQNSHRFQEYFEFTKLAARSTVFSIDIEFSSFVGNEFVCNNVPAYNSCNVAPQRACS